MTSAAAFNIEWHQIAFTLINGFYTLIMLVLAILAFSRIRSHGKASVFAGIAFILLTLVSAWNILFSNLMPFASIEEHNVVMTIYVINYSFSTLVNTVAMGLLFQAIFIGRKHVNTADKASKMPPSDNNISPLDDENPYAGLKN